MKWGVKNSHDWHLRFAWLPTQMDSGEWVWLTPYVAKCGWRYEYPYVEKVLPQSLSLIPENKGDA